MKKLLLALLLSNPLVALAGTEFNFIAPTTGESLGTLETDGKFTVSKGSAVLSGPTIIGDTLTVPTIIMSGTIDGMDPSDHAGDASAHHIKTTNTDAGSRCSASQYLDGDDTCKAISTITPDTFVTNKDTHDHIGGDGNQIDHDNLANVSTSDHHTATVNTDAESKCAGTDNYLDGEGNCDVLGAGTGDAVKGAPNTFTDVNVFTSSMSVDPSGFAVGFWHVVASTTLNAVSAVQFNGLDPAKMYRVMFNIVPSLDTDYRVWFSTSPDSYNGAISNYKIIFSWKSSHTDARDVGSAGSSDRGVRMLKTGRQNESNKSFFGVLNFAANPADYSEVQAFGYNRYYDASAFFSATDFSAWYDGDGIGDIQGIRLETVNGTLTGNIKVLALQ